MSQQTPKNRVLFVRRFTPVVLILLGVLSLLTLGLRSPEPAQAATTSSTINFQARLETSSGSIAGDGNYNVEFKLYGGTSCNPATGSGCSAVWTEDYLNSASQGVRVANGYLSVSLGSITAFPTTINWDQPLYISMNIGGTTAGTVTWDGAMLPYLQLTAVPYAFRAGQLATTNTAGTYVSTLGIQAPTGGNQTFQLQDQGAAGTYNLLTMNASTGISTLGTASTLTGKLAFANGSSAYTVTLTTAGETVGNATITIPNTAGANDTVCLQSLANCTGVSGGSVGGSGTANTIAMFTGSGYTVGNSIMSQTGTTIGVAGTLQATTLNANAVQTNGSTRIDVNGNFTGGTINSDTLNSTALTFSGANPIISTSTANSNLVLNANGTGSLTLDTGGAGVVNIAPTHATSVNIGAGSAANTTVNIGTNSLSANAITLGSSNASTAEKLQGGANYLYIGNAGLGINTTTPKTTLDISGASSRGYSTSQRVYQNVFGYSDNGNPDTGTFVIVMPNGWTNTMMTAVINGYEFAANKGAWQVVVSGYNYSTTPAWMDYSAQLSGNAPFSSVRLGYDGTHMLILLGTTSTTWHYPRVSVDTFTAGYSNVDTWGSGWSGSFVTSESGYTNVVVPIVNQVAYASQAFMQGGNSFSAAAILGTNDNNSVSIETNNITRFTIDTSGNGTLTGNLTVNGTGTSSFAGNLQSNTLKVGGGQQFQVDTSGNVSTTGTALVKTTNAAAFQVQNAGGYGILSVNSSNNTVNINTGVVDTTPAVAQLNVTSNWTDTSGDMAIINFGEGAATNLNSGQLRYDGLSNRTSLGALNNSGAFNSVLSFGYNTEGVKLENRGSTASAGMSIINYNSAAGIVIKPGSGADNAAAVQIQNASGSSILNVNTLNGSIDITGGQAASWTVRTAPTGNWQSVAYGNGTFVAVTSNNIVMTSPDGITWTSRAVQNDYWQSVTYANGLFVAVAPGGPTSYVMTSPDGITWTTRTAPAGDWFSVTYGNGQFVAVNNWSSPAVMTSPDGINWTTHVAPQGGWYSVTYGNGTFVAVANGGSPYIVMTSPDGVNWSAQAAPTGYWYSVTYGNGTFVAVGDNAPYLMTSPDGVNWTGRTVPDGSWQSVTYGNGLFVAVANYSPYTVLTSPDGISWTTQTAPEDGWYAVTYGNGTFVAVGNGSDYAMTSTNPAGALALTTSGGQTTDSLRVTGNNNTAFQVSGGSMLNGSLTVDGATTAHGQVVLQNYVDSTSSFQVQNANGSTILNADTANQQISISGGTTASQITFVTHTVPNSQWTSVAYGNGTFVAVDNNSTSSFMSSTDGATWTSRTASYGSWDAVTYGNGLFVAVNRDPGTGTHVMSSPDGVTWTARTAPSGNWYSLTYGNGKFVAVSSTSPYIMTSPDGVNWSTQTAPAGNWYSVTYANSLFVAVSNGGPTSYVMTSPDGVTWTAQTAPASNWYSITYGNGKFVAVAKNGSPAVMTSPDGVAWTAQTAQTTYWDSVTYGNNLFVAVPLNSSYVMTSPDGVAWTTQVAPSNSWYSIAYGNGAFVAVGQSSVMTGVSSNGLTALQVSGGAYSDLLSVGEGGKPVASNIKLQVYGDSSLNGKLSVSSNNTAAFQVQNASGVSLLNADTTNGQITVTGTNNKSELIIKANSTQTNPLVLLQSSTGAELARISAPDSSDLFFGYGSGNGNSGANNNAGFGSYALFSNTTGQDNTATGYAALTYSTTGTYNTATGTASLYENTSGGYNTGSGGGALYYNTIGSYNTGVGYAALQANTTGSYNTAIGTGANVGVNNLQGATAIGVDSLVTQSNSLVLGCVAGTNSCSTTTNVGIGNTAPAALFSVGSSSQLQVDMSGNLSTTGTAKVQTAANSTTALQVQNASANPVFVVDTSTTRNMVSNSGFETTPYTSGWAGTNATLGSVTGNGVYEGNRSLLVNVTAAGGGAQLTGFTTTLTPNNYNFSFEAQNYNNSGTLGVTVTGGSATCILNATTMSTAGYQRYNCSISSSTTNITAITVTSTGTGQFYLDAVQLSIGTGMQQYNGAGAIQLLGLVDSPVTVQPQGNSTTAFQIQNSAGSSNLFVADTMNNRIGIGTAAPGYKLDVQGGDINTSAYYRQAGQIVLNTTTGGQSTFVGVNAGNTWNSGGFNTALGYAALQGSSSTWDNTAIGTYAMNATTTGSYNTALGVYALQASTTATYNTSIGISSLYQNTTGSSNTANGAEALFGNTTGSNNTALGYFTMQTNTTGSQNTALGYFADVGSNNLQNATAIGAYAQVSQSNSLVLGCVAGTNNCATTTNVGIGNTAPAALFSVGSSSQFQVDNSGNLTTTGTGLIKDTSSTAFQVQNASGAALLTADTVNSTVQIRGGGLSTGSELFTSSYGFGAATGWTAISGTAQSATATHTNGGGTTSLVVSPALTFSGSAYLIQFTISGSTTGYVYAYAGGDSKYATGNGTTSFYMGVSDSSANLQFTPSNDFDGTITAVSIKPITPQNAVLQILDGAGNDAIDIRTGDTNGVNTFIGLDSGSYTSGSYGANSAVGAYALQYNVWGYENNALGAYALQYNTSGRENSAVGSYALQSNTTGSENVGVGSAALGNNMTGSDNTAIGVYALTSSQTGSENVALGAYSMNSNLTGDQNVAVGNFTLMNNTNGINNTAQGYNALSSNTTGYYNVGVGSDALQRNSGGSWNAALGTNAGSFITGSNNTAVGSDSLNSITSGQNNSALGYYAGYEESNTHFKTVSNLQNATAVGAYAQVQASNTIVLGSVDNPTQIVVGATVPVGTNSFGVSPVDLNSSTITATQASGSGTITASSAIFSASNVGEELVWADGTTETITAYTNSSVVTGSSTTITETGSYFRTHHIGLQVTNTGSAYVQNGGATAFQVQNSLGTQVINVNAANSTVQIQAGTSSASTGSNMFTSSYTLTSPPGLPSPPPWTIAGTGSSTTATSNNTGGVGGRPTCTTPNLPIIPGYIYNITFTATSTVGDGVAPSVGGIVGSYVYSSGTYTQSITAASTATVCFNGDANWFGITGNKISNISITQTIPVNATVSLLDSTGASTIEVRGGSSAALLDTFVGLGSGGQNTSGYDNSTLGYGALQQNTSGTDNTAVGTFALQNTTTGYQDTALGSGALKANTTGKWNVAVGEGALASNTTGQGNLALGAGADVASGNLQNATAIGLAAIVAQSNSIVLGGTGANVVNVGIGTSTPSAPLDVVGAVQTSVNAANATILIDNLSGSSQNQIAIGVAGTTKATIRVDSTGNLVMSGTGTGKLYLNYDGGTGGVQIGQSTYKNNLVVYGTSTTCTIGNGTGGTSCSSDARLKTNVVDLTNSLNNVMALRPVTFTWKDPSYPQGTNLGFIAQEVQQIFPESVSVNQSSGYYQLDYASLVVPAIGAIQQQQGEISGLTNQVLGMNTSVNTASVQTGNLGVSGGTTLQGATNVQADLNVTGATTLSSLVVNGGVGISGDLNVGGNFAASSLNVNVAVVNGDLSVAGLTTVHDIVVGGHLMSQGNTPTATLGSAAGEDGQVTIDGTDTAGTITVTVKAHQPTTLELQQGVLPEVLAPGDLADVTFAQPFQYAPRVVISPDNQDSIGLPVYITKNQNGYHLVITQAAQSGKTYQFDYVIIASGNN